MHVLPASSRRRRPICASLTLTCIVISSALLAAHYFVGVSGLRSRKNARRNANGNANGVLHDNSTAANAKFFWRPRQRRRNAYNKYNNSSNIPVYGNSTTTYGNSTIPIPTRREKMLGLLLPPWQRSLVFPALEVEVVDIEVDVIDGDEEDPGNDETPSDSSGDTAAVNDDDDYDDDDRVEVTGEDTTAAPVAADDFHVDEKRKDVYSNDEMSEPAVPVIDLQTLEEEGGRTSNDDGNMINKEEGGDEKDDGSSNNNNSNSNNDGSGSEHENETAGSSIIEAVSSSKDIDVDAQNDEEGRDDRRKSSSDEDENESDAAEDDRIIASSSLTTTNDAEQTFEDDETPESDIGTDGKQRQAAQIIEAEREDITENVLPEGNGDDEDVVNAEDGSDRLRQSDKKLVLPGQEDGDDDDDDTSELDVTPEHEISVGKRAAEIMEMEQEDLTENILPEGDGDEDVANADSSDHHLTQSDEKMVSGQEDDNDDDGDVTSHPEGDTNASSSKNDTHDYEPEVLFPPSVTSEEEVEGEPDSSSDNSIASSNDSQEILEDQVQELESVLPTMRTNTESAEIVALPTDGDETEEAADDKASISTAPTNMESAEKAALPTGSDGTEESSADEVRVSTTTTNMESAQKAALATGSDETEESADDEASAEDRSFQPEATEEEDNAHDLMDDNSATSANKIHPGNDTAPIIHWEDYSTFDKLSELATIITYMAAILSVIYSFAVHAFLSSFHERSFFGKGSSGSHWYPILFRVGVAIAIWGTRSILMMYIIVPNSSSLPQQAGAEVLIAIASIILSANLILQTRRSEIDGPAPPAISLEGKVVFITGANGGIGLETARQLYQRGATILLGCRSELRALDAMKDIEASCDGGNHSVEESSSQHRMHFIELDLTSIASVHKAVESFHRMKLPLHVLINNAGVMRNKREETVDGLEMTMAANHLGHFLLTNLLLPKLQQTSDQEGRSSRVITVSSSLYGRACRHKVVDGKLVSESGIDLNDLQCKDKPYALFDQYAQSKACNIMFALELGRREKNRCLAEQRVITEKGTTVAKKKKKLRPSLTPVNFAAAVDEVSNDEIGLGFDDIVASPGKQQFLPEQDIPSTATLAKKKKKKKIRPSLTPVEHAVVDEDDTDEFGLGFHEIVAPQTSPEQNHQSSKTLEKKKKKKLRPSLTPLADPLLDESDTDNVGLGFHEIVASKGKQQSPAKQNNQSANNTPEKKKKKKLRPSLTPVENSPLDESDTDNVGLGFHDIVASQGKQQYSAEQKSQSANNTPEKKKKKKKLRSSLTPVEDCAVDESDEDDIGLGFHKIVASQGQQQSLPEQKSQAVNTTPERTKKKKLRRSLTPVEICAMDESDEDDIGLGFHDVVASPGKRKNKARPKLSPSGGEEEEKKDADEYEFVPSKLTLPSSMGASDKKVRRRRRLTPLSISKSEEEDDEAGLGFNDVVSPAITPDKLKVRPKLVTPSVSPEGKDRSVKSNHGDEERIRHDSSMKDKAKGTCDEDASAKDKGCIACPVQSYCCHPGLVRTNVVRDMPWYLRYPNKIFAIFMAMLQKSPRSGAYTSVFCAVMDPVKVDNDECYFVNSELQSLGELALAADDAKRLWELSSQLVSIPCEK